MAGALPWLIFAATMLLASVKSSTAFRMAKPGCRETCGNLTIPYPFGIGPGCFYSQGFDVSCEKNRVFVHNSSSQMEIYNISLLGGQARVSTLIASKCFYNNVNKTDGWASAGTADFFTISSKANKLTAVGCNTLAFLGGFNKNSIALGAGCFSMCAGKQSVDHSEQCSGMGCCQTSIAPNLSSSNITFDDRFDNSEVRGFNPCSYAFVAEQDWFRFEASYLKDDKFTEKFKDGVPTVLDWVAGTESCDEAMKNVSSYACISKNGHCIMSPNATGYLCTCNDGFAGNPYLEEGCQDINECNSPDQYPCHGICSNTIGDYSCSCTSGTRSIDPKRETCNPIAASERAKLIGVTIGLSSGGGLLFLAAIGVIVIRRWKKGVQKQLRRRYFRKNKGILLEQLVSSDPIAGDSTKIFSLKELEKATNNFDRSRVVGRGGHGTIYKGILTDQRVVAIKRSRLVANTEIDQFINEVAILSQINHRNVVKLHGCCLEAEVPLLVYEFVSGGTLYDLLHREQNGSLVPLPWEERLRIATEVAGALTYLHSAASMSILHRDIKSMNVLLNDSNTAKVSDFGASRSIPINQTHVVTAVQGTFGYLDPEYYHTGQLTEKSDVYSFGVTLVELLMRKKPITENENGEKQNLSNYFLWAMGKRPLKEIVDDHVLEDGNNEVIKHMAGLARECLNLRRQERPTMKDVEMRLQFVRARKVTPRMVELVQPHREVGRDDERRGVVPVSGHDGTRQYSLEQEFMSSSRIPR